MKIDNHVGKVTARLLLAAGISSLIGAVANWGYEFRFASHLYNAGNPFARAIFYALVSFPVAFVGCLILGLPVALGLRRLGLQNSFTYGMAGLVAGYLMFYGIGERDHVRLGMAGLHGLCCALGWWWMRPKA